MVATSPVRSRSVLARRPVASDAERAARRIAAVIVVQGMSAAQLESYLTTSAGELLGALGFRDDALPPGADRDGSPSERRAFCRLASEVRDHAVRLGRQKAIRLSPLDDNLEQLAAVLDLSAHEQGYLRLGAVAAMELTLRDFLSIRLHIGRRPVDPQILIAGWLGLTHKELRDLLSRRSRLVRLGLCDELDDVECLTIDQRVAMALSGPAFQPADLLAHKLKRPAPARLGYTDFSHVADLPRLHRHLDRGLARRLTGLNVLIYGPPGTGKTELTRSLAASLDASLWEVPVSDEDGGMCEGSKRGAAFSLAQKLLPDGERAILVFDEIEDLFGSGRSLGFFGIRARERTTGKGWVNEQLETNRHPTLWLCNDIDAIDPAYIRRFDEVIELRAPPRAVRRHIVERYLPDDTVSGDCRDRIAEIEALPPAQIERVHRVLASMDDATQPDRDQAALTLLENSLRAMRVHARLPQPVLPSHYDPAQLNTDMDLATVTESLVATGGGRMLFYGPPGTGKSAFAHHLGQRLERPVLVRRASDLMSCYVGETEKQIASAFRAAMAEGAILLLDEADTFLGDRTGARHSWEVSQVNELLTQLEHFEGLFIASTNLIASLDAASLRRFDFKVKFDYLRTAQRVALFSRLCGDLGAAAAPQDIAAVERIDRLTPGDFAVLRRQYRHAPCAPSASQLAQSLRNEVALKGAPMRCIGFV